MLPSLAHVATPAKHTLLGSQQKARPVVGSRAQAAGGTHSQGMPGHRCFGRPGTKKKELRLLGVVDIVAEGSSGRGEALEEWMVRLWRSGLVVIPLDCGRKVWRGGKMDGWW